MIVFSFFFPLCHERVSSIENLIHLGKPPPMIPHM